MTKIIEVNNVNKSFGKNENINHVLNGASMSVDQGEFVSLMGASGSGKSTLLYLIGGLDRDFQGNISVCGNDIGSLKDSKLSDLSMSVILNLIYSQRLPLMWLSLAQLLPTLSAYASGVL